MVDCFSYIRKCSLLQPDSAVRLPFLPHNSFQMRSGYMNLAPLTCTPRTGEIIGTIGSCMDFDACESKNGTIFVHISQFYTFVAVFFEMSFFLFTFLFLDKWLIISLLEKKLSCLLFQPSVSFPLPGCWSLFRCIPRALVG